MTDSTINITDPKGDRAKFLKIVDTGETTLDGDAIFSISVSALNGLSLPEWDYASLSYTGANLTGIVYKIGGAGGTTVATLTLGYTGSDLISVTKT